VSSLGGRDASLKERARAKNLSLSSSRSREHAGSETFGLVRRWPSLASRQLDIDALGKFIAAPSPPGENLAYKMNVSFPALPRRAGLLSSVSEMRTPKPGTRVSNSSTR
jgi:hypothetical protein